MPKTREVKSMPSAFRFCKYCGRELPKGKTLNFCPYCGKKLPQLPTADEAPPVAAPAVEPGQDRY